MAVKAISLNSVFGRLINIIAILLCFLGAAFALRLAFGNMLAKQPENLETALLATTLAPNDPSGYYRTALHLEKTFIQEDFAKAVKYYEQAARLRPEDYRFRVGLAKAYERAGDTERAEKTLRRAAELAPNYAAVHWALGNLLLRGGNDEEAFTEIRKAVAQDNTYANQAVTTAWRIFDGDAAQISQKIGDSTAIRASLVSFLVGQNRFDEAYAAWESIPDTEKTDAYKQSGESILGKLFEQKQYRRALELTNRLNQNPAEGKFAVGSVYNGNFEQNVKTANVSVFDWQIAAGAQLQIGLNNNQKHGGEKSLVIGFNSQTGQEFRLVSQTVAVEAGRTYQFEAFYRSDLKTTGGIQWEIADAAGGKVLASTQQTAPVSDWAALAATFTVPANAQAVILRTTPVKCKQSLCPISGSIWFDDITLK